MGGALESLGLNISLTSIAKMKSLTLLDEGPTPGGGALESLGLK